MGILQKQTKQKYQQQSCNNISNLQNINKICLLPHKEKISQDSQ